MFPKGGDSHTGESGGRIVEDGELAHPAPRDHGDQILEKSVLRLEQPHPDEGGDDGGHYPRGHHDAAHEPGSFDIGVEDEGEQHGQYELNHHDPQHEAEGVHGGVSEFIGF